MTATALDKLYMSDDLHEAALPHGLTRRAEIIPQLHMPSASLSHVSMVSNLPVIQYSTFKRREVEALSIPRKISK
jgi:hypothetical protein